MGNTNAFMPADWQDTEKVRAGGGVIGTPGAPAVRESWADKGKALFVANAAPKMFDALVGGLTPQKVGTGGGMIGAKAAPLSHYGNVMSAKDKAVASMKAQQKSLSAARNKFLADTRKSIRAGDSTQVKRTDEDLNKMILRNPKRFYTSRDDKDKSSYISKYMVNSKYDKKGMSLADYDAEQAAMESRLNKSADAMQAWGAQPSVGKNVMKRPPLIPEFVYGDAGKGSVYHSDLYGKPNYLKSFTDKAETAVFGEGGWDQFWDDQDEVEVVDKSHLIRK